MTFDVEGFELIYTGEAGLPVDGVAVGTGILANLGGSPAFPTPRNAADILAFLSAPTIAYVGATFATIAHNHSADAITSGAMAKARQNAQTVYKDEANTLTESLTVNADCQALALKLNQGANKALSSFRDSTTAGFYVGSSPVNEFVFMGGGSIYFCIDDFIDRLRVSASGLYVRNDITLSGSITTINGGASFNGSLKLGNRTKATLPTAASSNGERFQVSDSDSVSNRVAFSNGSAWYYEGTASAV